MPNWTIKNRTVWSFNYVYLENVFTNHICNIYIYIYVKTGFSIKLPSWYTIKPNHCEFDYHWVPYAKLIK